jgi:hypoxanthine phosphoribosyltransferase
MSQHPALVEHVLSRQEIQARVAELGAQISADYAGRQVKLTCVLKGGFVFLADLIREITIPCSIDFMVISSYGTGTQSSGVVRILKDLDGPIDDLDVIVVEDIVDSGLTLSYLLRNLKTRKPATLEVCALLAKPARLEKRRRLPLRRLRDPRHVRRRLRPRRRRAVPRTAGHLVGRRDQALS